MLRNCNFLPEGPVKPHHWVSLGGGRTCKSEGSDLSWLSGVLKLYVLETEAWLPVRQLGYQQPGQLIHTS